MTDVPSRLTDSKHIESRDAVMPAIDSSREVAYKTLASELRKLVLQPTSAPDSRLPTEDELARQYGVSRQTVRRAFQELVADGMVHRVRGRGTFAAAPDERYIRQFGSVEDLMALSLDTKIEIVSPLHRVINLEAASRLRLESDAVFLVVFRRTHRDKPLCYTTVYLEPKAASKLEHVGELSEVGMVSDVTIIGLLDANLEDPIAEAEQSITATAADNSLAVALGCVVGEPLLRIDRIYKTTCDRYVELAVSHFLPDQYSYRVKLRRSARG
jgi:DNA-binding GntR family transcriptional regulator